MVADNFAWIEGPLELISSLPPTERPFSNKIGVFFAIHMATIHNILSRGFNASVNQAEAVRPGTQDAANFLEFNQFLFEFISNHHSVEDEVFFPWIEEANRSPGLTSKNSEQHKNFHDGLEKFGKYSYETTKDQYDPKKFLHILQSFRQPMQEHLRDEVESFLELKDDHEEALMKVHNEGRDLAIGKMDKFRVSPIMFNCHDKNFKIEGKGGPMEVPFFVPYLFEYYYTRQHRGSWRFAPCTTWNEPKPTPSFA